MSEIEQSSTTTAVETTRKQPNYAAVFWALLILTLFEIATANMPFPKAAVVLGLVFLAMIKASLVALFYMHLKFEKLIIYFIVAFPLFLAVILTVMVLADQAPVLTS
ncbi:MAG: cytochrome C oxidase subunit IV family protein [Candidatus Omnitrophica bacterium]|nr:cytochrome C oxidase subunit IV family protein [Candidatus Omnitrophota bacterium]